MEKNKRIFSTVPWLKRTKKRELSNPDYDLDDYEEDVELYGENFYNDASDEFVFEEGKDPINQDGVKLMDIYWVRYKKINVFFMVAKTKSHSVALFELETNIKEYVGEEKMPYETFANGFKPRKRPYIIPNNNCWTKTEYWVKTDKGGSVYIKPLPNSPICELDEARGRTPLITVTKCDKLNIEPLIEQYKNLCEVPFPVEGTADWLTEKELTELKSQTNTLARA